MPDLALYYIAGFVVFIQILILFFLWELLHKGQPHRDTLLEQSKSRTAGIIRRAIQQANKVLITAELKGIKLISNQKLTGNELTKQFNDHLAAVEKALQDQLIRNAEHAEQTYNEFLSKAEETIQTHIKTNEQMLSDKSNTMVAKTEEMLGAFTKELESKVKEDIERQMKEATGEIEQYKLTRMRVLDERIIDILEEVLKLVLEKKLTIGDQSDLVYKALAQAKKEHAFSTPAKGSES